MGILCNWNLLSVISSFRFSVIESVRIYWVDSFFLFCNSPQYNQESVLWLKNFFFFASLHFNLCFKSFFFLISLGFFFFLKPRCQHLPPVPALSYNHTHPVPSQIWDFETLLRYSVITMLKIPFKCKYKTLIPINFDSFPKTK